MNRLRGWWICREVTECIAPSGRMGVDQGSGAFDCGWVKIAPGLTESSVPGYGAIQDGKGNLSKLDWATIRNRTYPTSGRSRSLAEFPTFHVHGYRLETSERWRWQVLGLRMAWAGVGNGAA